MSATMPEQLIVENTEKEQRCVKHDRTHPKNFTGKNQNRIYRSLPVQPTNKNSRSTHKRHPNIIQRSPIAKTKMSPQHNLGSRHKKKLVNRINRGTINETPNNLYRMYR